MTPQDQKYLSWHFHDFVCVDWQYSRKEQRLQLHIRESWDSDEDSDAFLLTFEDVRYYTAEAESNHPVSPLFWILSTAFTKSERKKRLENHFDEPLMEYEIELANGYVDIICGDIHAKRLKADPPPSASTYLWSPPEPFSGEEREERILAAAQKFDCPFADFDRAEETLRLMEENNDPDLLPIVREILKLSKPSFLNTAIRLLSQCGTAEDLPLLYAHLPHTANSPYQRHLLLRAIDTLAQRKS